MPAIMNSIRHCTGDPSRSKKKEKEINGLKIESKEIELSLCLVAWLYMWKIQKNL